MTELRLLPLLASATEIVHALGLGKFQVGRSHECDYPPSVTSLPVCTRPAIPVTGSSLEIDQHVRGRLSAALSIYEVDTDLISALGPTHIITQTQCEVCAVSLKDVERALQKQLSAATRLISLAPHALADLWTDIQQVASACGHSAAGVALTKVLQLKMSDVAECAKTASLRPGVAAIEWLEPLMAAGNWVPELIAMAGGTSLFGKAGLHSPWLSWDAVLAADPEILIALPCGFDIAKTRAEMHWLTERPKWQSLSAVRNRQVYICDGNQYMNRSGPRLVESLQIFAQILHPALFPPSLRPGGWQPL